MADCPNPFTHLTLQSQIGPTAGFMAQVFLFAPNNVLTAPYNRGALIGIIADRQTGAMRVRLSSTGDASARVIDVPLGHGLLWRLQAAGAQLRTQGTSMVDARPFPLGDGEAAVREEFARGRAQLPGAGVLYWGLGDPTVRAQIVTEGNRAGQPVVVLGGWEHKFVGVQTHPCAGNEQPAPPPTPTPPGPDTHETPPGASSGFPWGPAIGVGIAATLVALWYKYRR